MWLLYLYGLWCLVWLAAAVIERIKKIPIDDAVKKSVEALSAETKRIDSELQLERARFEQLKAEAIHGLQCMSQEKAQGFPWLASAYSDYFALFERKLADELESKKQPAKRAAEDVRRISQEKALLRRENKILREMYRYYETLFPWLIDFKGEDLDDMIRQVTEPIGEVDNEVGDDPVIHWLSDAECNSQTLSREEKFQRALDRYWQTRKTPWQVGRDYERYIGFLHEKDGFKVEYHGIEEKLEDLGRDLICRKHKEIRIVQCKNWRSERTVHEKHICQLYGTAEAFRRTHDAGDDLFGRQIISAWLYTSCGVSPRAKEFADKLGVNVVENQALARYPMIKCNVSQRDGSKIYHLPFDQQYDRTLIEYKDECYVETVAEAEKLGFRRAFRWRGTRGGAV